MRDDSLTAEPSTIEPLSRRIVRSKWFWAYVVLIVIYWLYVRHQPMTFYPGAPHDDNFFMKGAWSVMNGEWMGPYSDMTLIKGPGFIYFLVLDHISGIPLNIALDVAYGASIGFLVWVLRKVAALPMWAGYVIFGGLLFEPAAVPMRVIRDWIYHTETLVMLTGLIALAFSDRIENKKARYASIIAGGLGLGMLWITREEGPWVALGVLFFVVIAVVRCWGDLRKKLLIPVVAFVVCAAYPVLFTSTINAAKYGMFTVADVKMKGLSDAIVELSLIDVGEQLPRDPVTRAQLTASYMVSPAMQSLEPYIEGADNWASYTCQSGLYPEMSPNHCNEFTGWFTWMFRDAAAAAGHFTSPSAANSFYEQIATEIKTACSGGEIPCRHRSPLLAPFTTSFTVGLNGDALGRVPSAMWQALKLTTYRPNIGAVAASGGPQDTLDADDQFIGGALLTPIEAPDDGPGVKARMKLGEFYGWLSPILMVAALLAWVGAVVMWFVRRSGSSAMVVVSTGAWIFYFSRLAVIALTDASAFPAVNSLYLLNAYVLLGVSVFTSLAAGVYVAAPLLRGRLSFLRA